MAENHLAELTKVVAEVTKSGRPLGTAIFVKVGENIAKAFDAKTDEVAILTLVHGGK